MIVLQEKYIKYNHQKKQMELRGVSEQIRDKSSVQFVAALATSKKGRRPTAA